MFQLGIDRLLAEPGLRARLKGKRVALLGHPASVTSGLTHSLDALMALDGVQITSVFGPQHGMRGEKQDNMIESADYTDPVHAIPVFSLYGEVRRPTVEMLESFDVILVDLQDVGCRIYTFLTTLFYMMQALSGRKSQELWVLDRPNPAGRPIEGNKLNMKFQSFVGAAPVPMRHGLTLGEAALWFRTRMDLDLNLTVIEMRDYDPTRAPGYGWPDLEWVNPSPNMPRLSTARNYAGTVLLEGTNLSEGRGTTIPLENFGAPDLDSYKILKVMGDLAPEWIKGCHLRPCYYEPTFHKFKGQLVSGLQIHVQGPDYRHEQFRPYRIVCLFLKAVHSLYPNLSLWLPPPYEYEKVLPPIDILSGGPGLREWVMGEGNATQWDRFLAEDEMAWKEERRPFLLYRA